MCYAQPGPRCSSHAASRLQVVTQELRQNAQNLHNAKTRYTRSTSTRFGPEHKSHDLKEQELATDSLLAAQDAYEKSALSLISAQDEYDETPEGQKKMRIAMHSARTSPEERIKLEQRLVSSRFRHHMKMNAYRRLNGNTDVSNHEIPNPQAIRNQLSRGEKIHVMYCGSVKEAHGSCEIIQTDSLEGQGKYVLRTQDGRFLEKVRGESIIFPEKTLQQV
jgi:hypothetical protein